MKKLLLFIFLSLLLSTICQNAFAENSLISTNPAVLNVQYDLPYPGILPDNPLYFLKALRDNVENLFITDPLKKANYDLLMADKRLAAADDLLKKGKIDLSITTLSKAENYFYLAVQQVTTAKNQGEDVKQTLTNFKTASLKHQQIISQMIANSKPNIGAILGASLKRAEDFQKSVEELSS